MKNSVPTKELTKKQRMQARIRRVKPLSGRLCVGCACVLFSLIWLVSILPNQSYAYQANQKSNDEMELYFVGDIALGRGIKKQGSVLGYDSIYENVSDFWTDADFVFANLESAVLQDKLSSYEESEKNLHLWTDYDGFELTRKAGVNVFACANNHAFDYGERPVLELEEYFKKNGVIYAGIGSSLGEAATYRILEHNGIRIAFLSITDVYYKYSAATESQGGILTTAYADYNQLVNQASKAADMTIVYVHWGVENQKTVSDDQVSLGHQLINAGADIVVGSHPHVVQRTELYKDGIIFYSLGNFIFDQGNTYARDSIMIRYTADQNGNGAFCIYPIRISDGVPMITTKQFYQARITQTLTDQMDENNFSLDENGFVEVPFNFTVTTQEESIV